MMMKKKETFGEYLKRERTLRNISLDELSKSIKVNKFYLEAIENDQYNILPGLTYLRGFVRNYAKYIGIDQDDTVLRLDTYLQQVEKQKKKVETDIKIKKINKTIWIYIPAIVSFLIIFIVVFSVAWTLKRNKNVALNSSTVHPTIKKAEEPVTQKTEGGQEEKKEEKSPVKKEKQNEIKIKIHAREKTWIMVRLDDSKPFDVVLWEENIVTWNAKKQISLRIGNAGGVDIYYNDVQLKNIGTPGEVIGIILPDDLNRFQ